MINARATLNQFMEGVGKLSEMDEQFIGKFLDLDASAGTAGGVISEKTKQLIAIAIGVFKQCPYSICLHTRGAYEAGATRAEIIAAAEVAVTFGAGPAMATMATTLWAAIDEFEHDFD